MHLAEAYFNYPSGTLAPGRRFSKICLPQCVRALEPTESHTLSTGYKVGSLRIQGISDEFIPAIVQVQQLDGIVQVSDGDSIDGAKAGKTAGPCRWHFIRGKYPGALQIQNELGSDAIVVTVLSKSNKKYLSTDLMKEELIKETYIAPEIELLDYKSVRRL